MSSFFTDRLHWIGPIPSIFLELALDTLRVPINKLNDQMYLDTKTADDTSLHRKSSILFNLPVCVPDCTQQGMKTISIQYMPQSWASGFPSYTL
jgi:hypothetical protein